MNDQGLTGEVISGTGDQINSNIEKKNLDDADKVPEAKGHDRYAKHVRKQQSEFDELGTSKGGPRCRDCARRGAVDTRRAVEEEERCVS